VVVCGCIKHKWFVIVTRTVVTLFHLAAHRQWGPAFFFCVTEFARAIWRDFHVFSFTLVWFESVLTIFDNFLNNLLSHYSIMLHIGNEVLLFSVSLNLHERFDKIFLCFHLHLYGRKVFGQFFDNFSTISRYINISWCRLAMRSCFFSVSLNLHERFDEIFLCFHLHLYGQKVFWQFFDNFSTISHYINIYWCTLAIRSCFFFLCQDSDLTRFSCFFFLLQFHGQTVFWKFFDNISSD